MAKCGSAANANPAAGDAGAAIAGYCFLRRTAAVKLTEAGDKTAASNAGTLVELEALEHKMRNVPRVTKLRRFLDPSRRHSARTNQAESFRIAAGPRLFHRARTAGIATRELRDFKTPRNARICGNAQVVPMKTTTTGR